MCSCTTNRCTGGSRLSHEIALKGTYPPGLDRWGSGRCSHFNCPQVLFLCQSFSSRGVKLLRDGQFSSIHRLPARVLTFHSTAFIVEWKGVEAGRYFVLHPRRRPRRCKTKASQSTRSS